ncbi:MAG: hypothetical protein Q8K72_10290, partial [Acidimicrobiales bacterium]|nr:hypothetical protein [Acidimicrobiales bacterium]
MRPQAVEVVVVDWEGPAPALSAGLSRLLALGIDVVVVASPASAQVVAGLPPAAVAGPGRLVHWPGGDGAADWAHHRLIGPGAPEGAVAVVRGAEELDEVLAGAGFPVPGEDHSWRIVVDRHDPDREREVESWLTVGNG